MTPLTGRTHVKYIRIYIDSIAPTLTEVTAYVNTVGTIGLTYDSQDVTAFSDGTKNIVIGQPAAPLTIGGPFDSVGHTLFNAINGSAVPLSLDIQIGIRGAWEPGAPQFGITSSAASGYLMSGYTVDMQANTWSATLDVFGPTAPAWNTVAET
jgi:hypothetical protein